MEREVRGLRSHRPGTQRLDVGASEAGGPAARSARGGLGRPTRDRGFSGRRFGHRDGASDRQPLAALCAAGIKDGAAAPRLHPHEKAVRASAAGLGGLVSALHGGRPLFMCPRASRSDRGNPTLHHEHRGWSTEPDSSRHRTGGLSATGSTVDNPIAGASRSATLRPL